VKTIRIQQEARSLRRLIAFCICVTSASVLAQQSALQPDTPKTCDSCEKWNRRREPFRIFGNTYFVGVEGLSSILITSDKGHILIDGGLPQSAPRIDESIRALGFRLQDVRLIAATHEHYDHAGGIAALQRASGAPVVASPAGARVLQAGRPTADDPQFGFGPEAMGFPAVAGVREAGDKETLRVNDLTITAHHTPAHTPGSTSWTWRSCEGSRCLNIVYADSLNAVSSDEYRFTAHDAVVKRFRQSIATIRALPCDILISVHPEFSNLFDRLKRREENAASDAFVDTAACRAYADAASKSLDRRLQAERSK
jgi:metallo-beta-lactamase class B